MKKFPNRTYSELKTPIRSETSDENAKNFNAIMVEQHFEVKMAANRMKKPALARRE